MEKTVLHKFFNKVKNYSFSIDYWDGSSENYGQGDPAFKVIFKDKISGVKILKDPSLALGEAYMDGIIDFEGNLQQIVETAYKINIPFFEKKKVDGLRKRFTSGNESTSLIKQRKDIQHHYDLGNDFYELWLDETMSYSCGYFCSPEDSLYQAQLLKIDYILKKLQLHPGESILDIGCGWGWLIIRAAQQYGVKALGITLSEEQYIKTKQRITEMGLAEQVDVKLIDYRTLAESLRLHYAKTLEHWSKNFEDNIDHVREKYDERFIKMWRLYLNSCAASFKASDLNIHQIVFSKGLNNELPMTRHYLYR